MANPEHLAVVKQGEKAIRLWREKNPGCALSLSGADLSNANLDEANLSDADLSGTNLRGAQLALSELYRADLSKACLQGANLQQAALWGANLTSANLKQANLASALLGGADLTDAELGGADLRLAHLAEANLTRAKLQGCRIFGISGWKLIVDGTDQRDLTITPPDELAVTVDELQVAQFIYLLLDNGNIKNVIDTIGQKGVLILGRFSSERIAILRELKTALRTRGFVPILFDFEKPSTRNLTETVSTLAHLSRFVIADLTDAKSIAQELQRIVPGLPSLPIQPLISSGHDEYAMFSDFLQYPWVLRPYEYRTVADLLAGLDEYVIVPAHKKAVEIEERRREIEQRLQKDPL